jgi:hypothetical protein
MGIADIEARIQQITTQFGPQGTGGILGTPPPDPSSSSGDSQNVSFADALAAAQNTTNATNATMPTSTGTNRAGVDSVQWARDFLNRLGMPTTAENVRAITAWEQAEGTAAHFNPLATTQSGFAGETRFNSVGVKNYATYEDGLSANVKAITNGLYGNILAALQAGNSADAVGEAIANSPWGTHGGVLRVLQSQSQ